MTISISSLPATRNIQLIMLFRESIAKHLEPLKGGKIPVEILVTTKDAEQKTKIFEKCLDIIKNAGVSVIITIFLEHIAEFNRKKLGRSQRIRLQGLLQTNGNGFSEI